MDPKMGAEPVDELSEERQIALNPPKLPRAYGCKKTQAVVKDGNVQFQRANQGDWDYVQNADPEKAGGKEFSWNSQAIQNIRFDRADVVFEQQWKAKKCKVTVKSGQYSNVHFKEWTTVCKGEKNTEIRNNVQIAFDIKGYSVELEPDTKSTDPVKEPPKKDPKKHGDNDSDSDRDDRDEDDSDDQGISLSDLETCEPIMMGLTKSTAKDLPLARTFNANGVPITQVRLLFYRPNHTKNSFSWPTVAILMSGHWGIEYSGGGGTWKNYAGNNLNLNQLTRDKRFGFLLIKGRDGCMLSDEYKPDEPRYAIPKAKRSKTNFAYEKK